VEIDSELTKVLDERGFQSSSSISDYQAKFDYVFTSNVLEHIQNDLAALQEIHTKLNHQGKLAIYVPAFQFLFSNLDTQVGHYRRYSKKELEQKLIQAGFEIQTWRYVDSLGVFAALVTKVLGYQGKLGLGGEKSLKLYDKILFPVSRGLDFVGLKRVLGKNLFLVVGKKDE
jgi:SAM-dependent methyltransferase